MTTFNTGNPVPSADARDRFDNSQTFDEVINGALTYYPNRVGQNVLSLKGMQSLFNAEQADRASAFSVEQDRRDDAFQKFIESSGWSSLGPYAAGVTITSHSQTVDYMGQPYQLKPSISVSLDDPYVTTGDWATESVNFKLVGDNSLRQDLALPDGLSNTGFIQDAVGAMPRDGLDKMRERASVKDFGLAGTGSGVTSDHAAALAMGAALGFIRFTRGNYVLDTCTLDYPVSFDRKANIKVNAGQTVTITDIIESPKQNIFKGDGLIDLRHDSDSGENAREIHASWFGAFPRPTPGPDQAPYINKAMQAAGNLRESVIRFDTGNYNISSQSDITRAALFAGDGTRRTVFKIDNDGYPVFKTAGVGVKFQGIQFELHPNITTRNSPYIEIAHGECSVDDAFFTAAGQGILITSNNARITNIMGVYGVALGAGSCLVHVAAGSGNSIDGVLLPTSQFAPESIVRVGGGAATVSGTIVKNLNYIAPCIGVLIDAVGTVGRTFVDGVSYNGSTAAKPDSLVTVRSSGSALTDIVSINGLISNSNSSAIVRIEHGSSADMRGIVVGSIAAGGTSAGNVGDGIVVIKTGAGALKWVNLSDEINVRSRLRPLVVTPSGAMVESYISPALLRGVSPSYSYSYSIADDTAVEIDLFRSMFVGRVDVCSGVSNYGQFVARAAPTPSINNIAVSANVNTLVSVLTGTTGVDGKLTVAPQPGKLYIENRLGSTETVLVVVNGAFS